LTVLELGSHWISKLVMGAMALMWLGVDALYGQQGEWQTQTLSNGMPVTYLQDSTRQLLHLGLTVRGGASLDPSEAQGLAKMYEHLFFQYLPDATPASMAADAGIFLSHKTLLETHFFGMSMPATQLPAALHLLQGGLSTTVWSDSTLDATRNALVPELQAIEFTPESHLATDLREALWQTWASRKASAGKYADILRLTSQRLLAEIAPYRHPSNCLLAATGPDPAESFFAATETSLGNWRPESAGALLPKIDMPPLTKSIYFQTVNEFAAHPLIMIAWPIPAGASPRTTSSEAQLFCTLAQLKQGKMYRRLMDSGLVAGYDWSWAGGLNPGQLLLYVIPEADSVGPCLQAIQAEIAQLGAPNHFTQEEVAIASRILQLQAAHESDQSISRLLLQGNAWMLTQANAAPDSAPDLAAMEAFARQYLSSSPHVAGLLLNSETALAIAADSIFHAATASAIVVAHADPSQPLPQVQTIDPADLRSMRIHFPGEPLTPDSSSAALLQNIAAMLRDQPQKRIYLNSFSEGLGDGVKNYQLSVIRAKAIRAWFSEEMGVPVQQIVIRAYGEAFPEFPDDNDLRNRRMTFEYAPKDAQDNAF
jgi:predicted Zn-dependent peptidase